MFNVDRINIGKKYSSVFGANGQWNYVTIFKIFFMRKRGHVYIFKNYLSIKWHVMMVL